MPKIAILGFGVVGSAVAELVTNNKEEIRSTLGEEISIARILDLRDFPDSPFSPLVVHDFDTIVRDPEVDVVVEAMGGVHPAYEYTVAALRARKSVVTSNKEVVARFGDEFLRIAKEEGVVYRFEAAVGGGIPVISPLISMLRHNKIREVRGILNGTTNYILTKMFTFGESFESALADAQARGYAERIPDADVLGTDACRKIAILSAIADGGLVDTERIPTEGITGIRPEDVATLLPLGYAIKLLGRSIHEEGGKRVMVRPFVVSEGSLLHAVSGVYNAVEVICDPLGRTVLYGPGAGGGATASAVVGDVMLVLSEGRAYTAPVFCREDRLLDEDGFSARFYVSVASDAGITEVFGAHDAIASGKEYAFFTEKMTLGELRGRLAALGDALRSYLPLLD